MYDGNCLKILSSNGTLIDRCKFPGLSVVFKGRGGIVTIVNPSRIKKSYIEVGNNCSIFIDDSCDIVGNLTIFATAENSKVTIGKRCSFSGVVIRMQGEPGLKVEIGDRCLFSSEINIRSTDSHTVYDINSLEAVNVPYAITIGSHVWVGYGCEILKNSVIKSNCVVGTRAVIAGKFDREYCAIAGIPARVVKENVNWSWNNTYDYMRK